MKDDIFANTISASAWDVAIFPLESAFQLVNLFSARRLFRRSKRLAWRLHALRLLTFRLIASSPSGLLYLRSAAGIKRALLWGEASCETRLKTGRARQKFGI